MTELEVVLSRKDKNGFYLQVAMSIAFGSKCVEGKQHGCIAVKHGSIVSTGYNGPPAGQPHCDECRLELYKQSHKGKKNFAVCPAVHAEMNCIVTAAKIGTSIVDSFFYVTKRPCDDCLKVLRNMRLAGVIYMNDITGAHNILIGPSLNEEFKMEYGGIRNGTRRSK